MKSQDKRWFIILTGGEENQILTSNFPDVDSTEIHIKTQTLKKHVTRQAIEVSHEQLQTFLLYVRNSGYNLKIRVAERIPETSTFRFAHKARYDDVARKKANRQRVVKRQTTKRTKKQAFVRNLKQRCK